MRMLGDQILAFLRRDLLIASRYRGAFVVAPVSVLLELAGAYYLARAIGSDFRPDGFAYFPFLLVGTAITQVVIVSTNAFVDSVHEAQVSGTMETLMTTSTSPLRVMLLSAGSLILNRFVLFAAYLGFGLTFFRIPLPNPNLLVLTGLVSATVLITLGFGICAASVQMYFQKGSGIVWLFASVAWLLCGSMFPVSALPGWLQSISHMIPITHLVDSFRRALLGGAAAQSMLFPLAWLGLFGLVLLPVSIFLFSAVLRDARMRGTLSLY